jgi:hypothetical protein
MTAGAVGNTGTLTDTQTHTHTHARAHARTHAHTHTHSHTHHTQIRQHVQTHTHRNDYFQPIINLCAVLINHTCSSTLFTHAPFNFILTFFIIPPRCALEVPPDPPDLSTLISSYLHHTSIHLPLPQCIYPLPQCTYPVLIYLLHQFIHPYLTAVIISSPLLSVALRHTFIRQSRLSRRLLEC